MENVNKYLMYLKTSFKVNTAYYGNYFIIVVFDLVYFFVFYSLWTTVYKSNSISEIAGYSLASTITYYFISEIIFKFTDVLGSVYLNWQVWSGYFTNDLVKPWNVLALNYIDAFSEKVLNFAVALPTFLVMFLVAKEYIILPSGQNTLFVIVTVLLSFVMSIAFNLCLHVLVFKFGDQDSNIDLANFIAWFLAGAFFPLAFLPQKIQFIFDLLPFKYIFNVPANVFLGRLSVREVLTSWLMIILWIGIFVLIYKTIYKKTIKYYSGTGR